jgi:hypothetical protein
VIPPQKMVQIHFVNGNPRAYLQILEWLNRSGHNGVWHESLDARTKALAKIQGNPFRLNYDVYRPFCTCEIFISAITIYQRQKHNLWVNVFTWNAEWNDSCCCDLRRLNNLPTTIRFTNAILETEEAPIPVAEEEEEKQPEPDIPLGEEIPIVVARSEEECSLLSKT